MKSLLIFCCLSVGCLAAYGQSVTRNVPAQYPTIQAAINASANTDIVVIAPGVYSGEGNVNISTLGLAITVKSDDPADPAVVKATVVDCGGFGNGFYFQLGEGASTIVEGLTITNAGGFDGGGALVCSFESSPTIRNCVIVKNFAFSDGAGLFSDWGCNPIVEHCQFISNISLTIFDENLSWGWGGAISVWGGSPVIRDCIFANNYAVCGGAISLQEAINPQIINCVIVDNLAKENGSAVYAVSTAALKIDSSILWGNSTTNPGGDTIHYSGQNASDTATIAYSDIQGYLTDSARIQKAAGYLINEIGIIDADPKFVQDGLFALNGEYTPGNWHLQKISPCINAGNPAYVAAAGEVDIDGEARVMNGRVEIGVDEVEMAIAAKIDIVPGKLVLPCKGFVLAMIRLPDGYSVKDIDPKSILWDGKLAARCLEKCRHNAIAVFDLGKVSELLGDVEGKVEITVTGQLTDGTAFAGSDIVQVNQVHWKDWFKRLCHHSDCKNHSDGKNHSDCEKHSDGKK
jgi:hypothetical protein